MCLVLFFDLYEDTVVERLGKHQFKEMLRQKDKIQLDIFLINNPSDVINRSEVNEFNRSLGL